jgi:hypothetical protein
MVPLDFIERLERAQLEILAIQLYIERRRGVGDPNPAPWQGQESDVRERYRTDAHTIMQGEEPGNWAR